MKAYDITKLTTELKSRDNVQYRNRRFYETNKHAFEFFFTRRYSFP